jgi:hypothetical protein
MYAPGGGGGLLLLAGEVRVLQVNVSFRADAKSYLVIQKCEDPSEMATPSPQT